MPPQYSPVSYPPRRLDYDDYADDDYPPPSDSYSRASSVLPPDTSPFYTNSAELSYYMTDSDAARRMRLRPSPDQIEELRKLYAINPHPSAEERQVIAERIGM